MNALLPSVPDMTAFPSVSKSAIAPPQMTGKPTFPALLGGLQAPTGKAQSQADLIAVPPASTVTDKALIQDPASRQTLLAQPGKAFPQSGTSLPNKGEAQGFNALQADNQKANEPAFARLSDQGFVFLGREGQEFATGESSAPSRDLDTLLREAVNLVANQASNGFKARLAGYGIDLSLQRADTQPDERPLDEEAAPALSLSVAEPSRLAVTPANEDASISAEDRYAFIESEEAVSATVRPDLQQDRADFVGPAALSQTVKAAREVPDARQLRNVQEAKAQALQPKAEPAGLGPRAATTQIQPLVQNQKPELSGTSLAEATDEIRPPATPSLSTPQNPAREDEAKVERAAVEPSSQDGVSTVRKTASVEPADVVPMTAPRNTQVSKAQPAEAQELRVAPAVVQSVAGSLGLGRPVKAEGVKDHASAVKANVSAPTKDTAGMAGPIQPTLAALATAATHTEVEPQPDTSRMALPKNVAAPDGSPALATQLAQTSAETDSPQQPSLQSPIQPQAVPASGAPQAVNPTPLADNGAAFRLAPQLENTIEQLAQTRSDAQASKPELTVRHQEFGAITMRLDATGNDLRATLSARDPGFVPAIQAALAERGVIASSETSGSNTQRGNDQASAQSGSQGNSQSNAFTGSQSGFLGQGWNSGAQYGSSTGGGQGTSQPYAGQTSSQDEDAAPDRVQWAVEGGGSVADGERFA